MRLRRGVMRLRRGVLRVRRAVLPVRGRAAGHVVHRPLEELQLVAPERGQEVGLDAAKVGRGGRSQALESDLGQDRLGAPGVARAGEPVHEPVLDEAVDEPGDPAPREQDAVGEAAHPQPPLGRLGELEERRVFLE